MSDCVILTRYWDKYPLETVIGAVTRRFDVGPFHGEAAASASEDAAPPVVLRFADDSTSEPVKVLPGDCAWVARGPVAYRVERTSLAPRMARRLRPDLGVVLGVGFSLTVVAAIFSWAAMSLPPLNELDEDAPRTTPGVSAPAATLPAANLPAANLPAANLPAGRGRRPASGSVGTTPRLSLTVGNGVE